jgi:hypothetical protein
MKKLLVGVALLVMLCIVGSVQAANEWSLLAKDGEVQARVALWPAEGVRAKVGPFVAWNDDGNIWTGGAFATYDLMQQQDFRVLFVEVPATLYVGGMIGATDASDPKAVVRLLTGLDFGDGPTRLGFEIQYGLDRDFWRQLGDDADGVSLFFRLACRF